MQKTGDVSPELQMQAEKYVGTGYQRLLTFEVDGGGFSLMGNPPARVFLTAYGLMEFNDMAKVYPVDEAVIERAARWLLEQQQPNGTWQVQDYRAGQGCLQQCGTDSYCRDIEDTLQGPSQPLHIHRFMDTRADLIRRSRGKSALLVLANLEKKAP